jgi:Zn-dependent peptidase ImmA (M78 family)
MLDHRPDAHFAELGIRFYDRTIEREADWLAGCLLVPTKAVLPVLRRLRSMTACAGHFGVSEEMMRQRYNLSGAKTIIDRSTRRKQRASTS